MTRTIHTLLLTLLLTTLTTTSWADSDDNDNGNDKNDSQLDAAQNCVSIAVRLERLACFDRVFGTPVADTLKRNEYLLRPDAWSRAWKAEAKRKDSEGFTINYVDPTRPEAGIWLTARALKINNDNRQRPILMLSCIDNISRVELVLSDSISTGKAQVTISGHHSVTQRWVSDESGTVVRTGRGLAAIDVMKALLSADNAVLRSNVEPFTRLNFDTSNLSQLIKPMRQVCRW